MTVRLTVRTTMWRSHVARFVNDVAHTADVELVPVVKGNGYGFGRTRLAGIAAEFADTVAVGTVHELDGLPAALTPVVLTPTLSPPDTTSPILTVGHASHVDSLRGWSGRVLVKLVSPMRRYGGDAELVGVARTAGLDVVGVSVHPPLGGDQRAHADAVAAAIEHVDTDLPVWVSHLEPSSTAMLPQGRAYRLRVGTALWHGDKSTVHLTADVLDVRPVAAGDTAGYRLGQVRGDGHLVMVGAGTAHGIAPLTDGRSPFHHARRRLELHEPPHMHTSMVFVASGEPVPAIGDRVDVQRPLHMTEVDEYEWL